MKPGDLVKTNMPIHVISQDGIKNGELGTIIEQVDHGRLGLFWKVFVGGKMSTYPEKELKFVGHEEQHSKG